MKLKFYSIFLTILGIVITALMVSCSTESIDSKLANGDQEIEKNPQQEKKGISSVGSFVNGRTQEVGCWLLAEQSSNTYTIGQAIPITIDLQTCLNCGCTGSAPVSVNIDLYKDSFFVKRVATEVALGLNTYFYTADAIPGTGYSFRMVNPNNPSSFANQSYSFAITGGFSCTSSPSLVISPNGDTANYGFSGIYSEFVEWNSALLSGSPTVKIALEYCSGGIIYSVIVPNNGFYHFYNGGNQLHGDYYTFRITSTILPCIQDTSDSCFYKMID
jgi:hypothetical protein